jgi:phenylpropionate dioxygenase-like ring-hydroxylating dioxygenase large terminal subunit
MRHERQVELLTRIADAGEHLGGLRAPASIIRAAHTYTDDGRFAEELRILFREGPVFFGLSAMLPNPGDYISDTVGGVPLVVSRQSDGELVAMVNACRHRGAPVVEPGSCGDARAFACPYHGWVYAQDGVLKGRPGSGGAFDDLPVDLRLHRVALAEKYGLVFVRPGGGDEPIDVDEFLSGAERDLSDFGLERYTHVATRVQTWKMNWKLFFDTFTETYHIRTLHKETLLPYFNADSTVFDGFGRHCLSIGLRKNVLEETQKPVADWSILPYGTIQYFLIPTGLVVHQIDHVEIWRVEPLDARTSRLTISIFAPSPPESDKARDYYIKNLDLLLRVTGQEDFPLMEQIQANLDSGALPEVIFGRNEAPLVHYHQEIDRLLGL